MLIRATVTRIVDGDTFNISPGWAHGMKRGNRVRIAGIDTPERGEPDYEEAKQQLSRVVFNEEVALEVLDIDVYDRLVCNVFLDGVDIRDYIGYSF